MRQTPNYEPMPGHRVLVNRGNGQTFEANTTHRLYYGILNENMEVVGRGPFIAVGIRTDRDFHLYAQPEQIEMIKEAAA